MKNDFTKAVMKDAFYPEGIQSTSGGLDLEADAQRIINATLNRVIIATRKAEEEGGPGGYIRSGIGSVVKVAGWRTACGFLASVFESLKSKVD